VPNYAWFLTLAAFLLAGPTSAWADTGHTSLADRLDTNTWLGPEGIDSTLRMAAAVTIVSLAPAVLVMMTSFVRISVVLGFLRQALGASSAPPQQVTTGLSLLLTMVVMAPVARDAWQQGVVPYQDGAISDKEAFTAGMVPIRRFMADQIERTGNTDDVWLFLSRMQGAETPETYEDVPLEALLPAYALSELKTAYLIGFQIFLPFLILDLIVAAVTASAGLVTIPAATIAVPCKILLFLLLDGWHLVVGMLLDSFAVG
jgi:flagellar biosynthetic protein FliP